MTDKKEQNRPAYQIRVLLDYSSISYGMWRALTSRTQDLESLVLDEQSVSAEFALLVQERVDNQARAEGWPDPESMEANYDAWGRLAGIYSEYNTGTSIGHFWSRISMYRTEAGAREAFDHYRQGGQNASIQGFQEAGPIRYCEKATPVVSDRQLSKLIRLSFRKRVHVLLVLYVASEKLP